MAPIQDIDPNDLSSAGWGVIFAPGISPEIRDALHPLLELRRQQAGRCFRTYSYKIGQTHQAFFAANGAGPGPVDPAKVPYYLLIVGDPTEIPFEFQYALDVQYAVGRISFDSAEDYASYSAGVIAAESGARELPRKVTLFGTEHLDDLPTALSIDHLMRPLAESFRAQQGWEVDNLFGEQATAENLWRTFEASRKTCLFLSATHGLSLPPDSRDLVELTGSLVSQDWPGHQAASGPLTPDFYFSAADIPDQTDLTGLVAFLFGDNTAGLSEFDDFDLPNAKPRRISPRPFVSTLAKRLLSLPKGAAQAVIGHVGRAWTTSFYWKGSSRIETFAASFQRLIGGCPVGYAMEYLNQMSAELSAESAQLLQDWATSSDQLETFWRAARDARNWIVLGDPAVRLCISFPGSARYQPIVVEESKTSQAPTPVLSTEDATPRAATEETALDIPPGLALEVAFRLVIARRTSPDLLVHLDPAKLRSAAETLLGQGSSVSVSLSQNWLTVARDLLASEQPGIDPNPLWLAWMTTVQSKLLEPFVSPFAPIPIVS